MNNICFTLEFTFLSRDRSNDELLITLEGEKQPFLFSSDALAKIVESTTSVKTKLNIIVTLSYRLTDPRSKMEYFVNLFRFSEEKSQVEDAFKFRIQALNGSLFKREVNTSSLLSPKGGRGGRGRGAGLSSPAGGRGGAGRGPGMSPVRSSITGTDLSTPTHDHQESKSRPFSLPVNGALSPLRDPSPLSVFSNLAINSSSESHQNSGEGPDSLSRPVDSDDDSGDESPMQISFKPFGSAVSTPVKQPIEADVTAEQATSS